MTGSTSTQHGSGPAGHEPAGERLTEPDRGRQHAWSGSVEDTITMPRVEVRPPDQLPWYEPPAPPTAAERRLPLMISGGLAAGYIGLLVVLAVTCLVLAGALARRGGPAPVAVTSAAASPAGSAVGSAAPAGTPAGASPSPSPAPSASPSDSSSAEAGSSPTPPASPPPAGSAPVVVTFDTAALQQQIAAQYQTQYNQTVTVTCPQNQAAAAGTTFECTVDGSGQVLAVTVTDNAGHFTWATQ